ncbi:pre-mRNA-splicing factor spp2 [Moelleriella libera RCEF 2490]|uniref:Pre-mRNA-splicing factor n=1 Tax=Moelleriella libera RCEF 2490 TaxID=1081109 RepID=A0A167X6G8_9HYPO|nr:pre-mRNA-splicing factor spp2 [Moelleriella libera RCEF 2490]
MASETRVAIKLGKSSSRSAPPSTLGKRSHLAALGGESDSDSDRDDDSNRRSGHEAIIGFGSEGAESRQQSKSAAPKRYVITRQANVDWRSQMKRQRQGGPTSPHEEPAAAASQSTETTAQGISLNGQTSASVAAAPQWGLTVKEKKENKDGPEPEPESTGAQRKEQKTHPEHANGETEARTIDQEAMDALLGRLDKPSRVIQTEDDVYKRDAAEAGAASTLEDYEAMPVEEFGAALLRGMGWNGELKGNKNNSTTTTTTTGEDAAKAKRRMMQRRQNHLGLGAQELKGEEDLGQWNQNGPANKKPRPRLVDYRREEAQRKERRGREDSYKRERDRDRQREREHQRDRVEDRDGHRRRDWDRSRDDRRTRGREKDLNWDRSRAR